MAYTKFTGWENTTLPKKMRAALANIEDGVEQGINAAAAAQTTANAALPKTGGTMSGPINMGSQQITNLKDPSSAQHAATKAYVDAGDTTNATAAAAAKSAADAAATTANAALPKSGGTMTGAINMGSKQITNMAAPTADAHAATKKYVDDAAAGVASQLGSYLPTAGGAMSGPIDMNSNKITEVPTPQANTDAANKKYVDDTVSPVSTVASSAASTASAANTAAANAQTAINNHKADTAVHVAFSTTNPVMDGTAAVGTATTVSRSDHVHPSDTSRAPKSHASTATTYGAASASNYGHAMASGTTPKMDGTAAVGSETAKFARGDHVHPTDTSRQATITGAATTITSSNLTASRALISNSSGKVAVSAVTSTELSYLDGVTSAIQTQLNTLSSEKAGIFHNPFDHNGIFRGKNLGTAITDEQYAQIAAGTFDDLYIGDYWTINNVVYRIAHFDYYYYFGDTACTKHHITLVPDNYLYTHVMNDTADTTGAYVGSKMYTEGLNSAIETISAAFGDHLLTHRNLLANSTNSDGYANGWAWYDRQVDLMTEAMVYGTNVWSSSPIGNGTGGYNTGVEWRQLALFALGYPPNMGRYWFWLQDVVSAPRFAGCDFNGFADCLHARYSRGVRPCFSVS